MKIVRRVGLELITSVRSVELGLVIECLLMLAPVFDFMGIY